MGKRVRVNLNVDLTRYHEHLVVGSKGYLIPHAKYSAWGWSDIFGGVEFDCCGHKIDVLFSGLTVEKEKTISRREQLMKKPIPYLKIMVEKKHRGMFTEEQLRDITLEELVDILDE